MRTPDYTSVAVATSEALKECWKDPKWKANVLARRAALQRKTSLANSRVRFGVNPARFFISFEKWNTLTKAQKKTFAYNATRAERYGMTVRALLRLTRGERYRLTLNYNKEKSKNG